MSERQIESRPKTLEEKARAVLFGWPSLVKGWPDPVTGDAWVQGGYDGRCEPVTGRGFATFKGLGFTEPGERPAEGSIQPTPEEAMRVHVYSTGVRMMAYYPGGTVYRAGEMNAVPMVIDGIQCEVATKDLCGRDVLIVTADEPPPSLFPRLTAAPTT